MKTIIEFTMTGVSILLKNLSRAMETRPAHVFFIFAQNKITILTIEPRESTTPRMLASIPLAEDIAMISRPGFRDFLGKLDAPRTVIDPHPSASSRVKENMEDHGAIYDPSGQHNNASELSLPKTATQYIVEGSFFPTQFPTQYIVFEINSPQRLLAHLSTIYQNFLTADNSQTGAYMGDYSFYNQYSQGLGSNYSQIPGNTSTNNTIGGNYKICRFAIEMIPGPAPKPILKITARETFIASESESVNNTQSHPITFIREKHSILHNDDRYGDFDLFDVLRPFYQVSNNYGMSFSEDSGAQQLIHVLRRFVELATGSTDKSASQSIENAPEGVSSCDVVLEYDPRPLVNQGYSSLRSGAITHPDDFPRKRGKGEDGAEGPEEPVIPQNHYRISIRTMGQVMFRVDTPHIMSELVHHAQLAMSPDFWFRTHYTDHRSGGHDEEERLKIKKEREDPRNFQIILPQGLIAVMSNLIRKDLKQFAILVNEDNGFCIYNLTMEGDGGHIRLYTPLLSPSMYY